MSLTCGSLVICPVLIVGLYEIAGIRGALHICCFGSPGWFSGRTSPLESSYRGKPGKIAHLTFKRTKRILNTKASIRN